MSSKVYLKPNFVAEPLVDGWYAWSHLVSPVTASLNLKNKYLPMLKSFLKDPASHALAVKDPSMLGGPFIDLEPERVPEVKRFLAGSIQSMGKRLAFANALEQLQKMLLKEADGHSLIPLYDKVPKALKGYVELVYDNFGRVDFRLKEALLYKEPWLRGQESFSMYLLEGDRPFVLTTPVLEQEGCLHLSIPFDDPRLDALFAMEHEARSFEEICDLLEISKGQKPLFSTFFQETPSPIAPRYEGDFVRLRYFGHACLLIETKESAILVDPVIAYGGAEGTAGLSYADLPEKIDYVLVTHNHQDHILLETLFKLRHRIGEVIVPQNSPGTLQDPDLKLMFQALGFKNTSSLGELEEKPIPFGQIVGLPFFGEHGDLDVVSKLGYLVELSGYRALFLADSNVVAPESYAHLHRIYGDVDVVFIGMECDGAPLSWMYGPYSIFPVDRKKDQSRRLSGSNFEAARAVVDLFNCKEAYVYAMGLEPWVSHISIAKMDETSNPILESNRLLAHCMDKGLIAERLFGQKELLAPLTAQLEPISQP